MNSRQKINAIANRKNTTAGAFWTGHPHPDTVPLYINKSGKNSIEEVYTLLNDDCRWIWADSSYRHPEGRPMFDVSLAYKNAPEGGCCFAECEDAAELEKFPWPDVNYLDFSVVLSEIEKHQDKAVFSGFWSHFFHLMCDFFGMENYFVKMYSDPAVIEAATNRITDFFVEANDRFLQAAGDKFDTVFFGNDFGTQLDLLISPEMFDTFVLPSYKRLIAVAKKHGKKVMLHSCGAIYRVIPSLIDAGVDVIHPIQALAKNMDAQNLVQFKNAVAFCGGIDTQGLLPNGTPAQVKAEVRRIRDLLGPNLIISPSHEALLPNIPFENVLAMAEEAQNG